MRFASADEAMRAIFAEFGPIGDPDWRFHYGLKAEPIDPRHPDIRSARGSIARTMHFGSVCVELSTGVVEFIDEDHRDGGDDLRARASLPQAWLEALAAIEWPGS